jgi:DNA-binding LytR/AlgR family response regulator
MMHNAPLTCCIADDSPAAASRLATYINDTHGLLLVGTFTAAEAALQFMKTNPPHLLFCDIDMPVMSGLQLAGAISDALLPVHIIFTTAYKEHAVEAYRLHVLDYLIKPIERALFKEAVSRAMSVIGRQQQELQPISLMIRTGKGILKKIPVREIYYIEILRAEASIYLEKEQFTTTMPLIELEARLAGCHFLRTHKSFLVAEQFIDRLEEDDVILLDGRRIPVSRTFRPVFLKYFR